MIAAVAMPIAARHRNVNRAEVCDQNFIEFVQGWAGRANARPGADQAVLPGSLRSAADFEARLDSQLISRHLDLMARVLRVKGKVFYTIGSSGHEGNAMVARLPRHTDPAFLHLRTTRIMGHAGTDFEIEWRSGEELMAVEASDPLLRSAQIALESGLYTRESLLAKYAATRAKCFAAAEQADRTPKLETLEEVIAPLAPYTPAKVQAEAVRADFAEQRTKIFGSEEKLPEKLAPRHLAIQINNALQDLFCKYPEALLFGEDVAQKGGVYTVTKGLFKNFSCRRVFNTLLDETMILGLDQGYANVGMLTKKKFQYMAFFRNASDQIRGEACSLQFFSNGQYRNPMVMRIASLGYQRGFGGHFHNDNSITALRDIPALVVGCPSRGDEAATMLRTLMALAKVDGRVCAFLEPIALYMTKDLYEAGDGQWLTSYPDPDQAMVLGEERVYLPA